MPGPAKPLLPTTNRMARHLGNIHRIARTHSLISALLYIEKLSGNARILMSTHSSQTSASCMSYFNLLPSPVLTVLCQVL